MLWMCRRLPAARELHGRDAEGPRITEDLASFLARDLPLGIPVDPAIRKVFHEVLTRQSGAHAIRAERAVLVAEVGNDELDLRRCDLLASPERGNLL